jgi:MFS family permease
MTGPVRRFYLATLLGAVGNGLILSLSVVYLHDIRHQSIFFSEMVLTINGFTVILLSGPIGSLTDKLGPLRVMVVGLLVEGAGLCVYAFATTRVSIVATSILIVLGGSAVWGPSSVLLTRLVAHHHRQSAYGLNFQLLNLGIGVGLAVSALIVNLHDSSTFTALYLGTALMTLCTAGVMVSLAPYGRAVEAKDPQPGDQRGGWREVLADRRLRRFISASLVLVVCGYGSIETGFSLYIVNVAHLSVKFIGIIFIFNTVTIVVGQPFTIRLIQGRSRTMVMCVVGLLWGSSWLLVATTVLLPHYVALGVLCLSTVIFAMGETFWSPVAPALVNEMAPEHLRGRYNAASGFTWSLSGVVAPLLTGLFIGSHIGKLWPLFVAGGAIGGGLFATTLRHRLTPQEDGRIAPVTP